MARGWEWVAESHMGFWKPVLCQGHHRCSKAFKKGESMMCQLAVGQCGKKRSCGAGVPQGSYCSHPGNSRWRLGHVDEMERNRWIQRHLELPGLGDRIQV